MRSIDFPFKLLLRIHPQTEEEKEKLYQAKLTITKNAFNNHFGYF